MPENSFSYLGRRGFDADRYFDAQSDAIIARASKFEKLYLEFGGKLLYDYHAARVLPGYRLDGKMEVIRRLDRKRPVEFLFCVSARDLESGKRMGALGISYRDFSLKMLDSIKAYGFSVPAVAINLFSGEPAAKEFGAYLKKQGYAAHFRGLIKGYPTNISAIASSSGFGKKPFFETEKPIVIVTGAGPNSGKMATCLSMVYQDHLRNRESGYAKLESFPIWNLPLDSAINAAYEAATADIGDFNLIDPWHLKAYGKKSVNYNRDVEGFSLIHRMFRKIASPSNFMNTYKSPTDMGINFMKEGITDLALCEQAARQEVIRRYFSYRADFLAGIGEEAPALRVERLMRKCKIPVSERKAVLAAREAAMHDGHSGPHVGSALMLSDGSIVKGQNSPRMHAESAAIMNALKRIAGISEGRDILSQDAIAQIRKLRKKVYEDESENLSVPEILIVLAVSAKSGGEAEKAFSLLGKLRSCELHTTHALRREDTGALRALGINFTSDAKTEVGKLYVG